MDAYTIFAKSGGTTKASRITVTIEHKNARIVFFANVQFEVKVLIEKYISIVSGQLA